jgi:hypothetical protein
MFFRPEEVEMKTGRQGLLRAAVFSGVIVVIITGTGLSLRAQVGLPEKPFNQWSKDEVKKILTDSIWAKTQTVRLQRRSQVRSIAGQTESETLSGKGELTSAEDPLEYKFTLRLHSALPIRQALLRQEQLKWNYEKRSLAERKAFDAEGSKALLDCPVCADFYVLSVGFGSENSSGNDLIHQWFGSATLPLIKDYITLANDRGERRALMDFIPPKKSGDDVFFIFPRRDERGQLLFTPASKKLIFRMSDKSVNSVTNFTLDITRLLVDGNVRF